MEAYFVVDGYISNIAVFKAGDELPAGWIACDASHYIGMEI